MSCGACEDGWIYTDDASRACRCQVGQSPYNSRDYTGHALTRSATYRAMGRRGGLASGVKRRQLAKGRRIPNRRTRNQALALRWPRQQVSRSAFEILYYQARPTGYPAGCDTAWEHYVSLHRRYRRDNSQHYRTTNTQRAIALAGRGKPRCRRTIQRLNRLMGEMGLAVVSHYKDQRDTPGHKDCLVVEIRYPKTLKNVTPSSGEHKPLLRRGVCASTSQKSTTPAPPGGREPPPAGGNVNDGIEEEGSGIAPGPLTHRGDHLAGGKVIDVAGGGGETGVPELLLDDVDWNTLHRQFKRMSVSQAMWMNPTFDPSPDRSVTERFPKTRCVESLADRGFANYAKQLVASRNPQLPPARCPELERVAGLWVEPDDAALTPLTAKDGYRSGDRVDVLGEQGERLGDPQAGAPEQDDQRPVSSPGIAAAAGPENSVNLIACQDLSGIGIPGICGLHAQTVTGLRDGTAQPATDQDGAVHSSRSLRLVNAPSNLSRQVKQRAATPPDAPDDAAPRTV